MCAAPRDLVSRESSWVTDVKTAGGLTMRTRAGVGGLAELGDGAWAAVTPTPPIQLLATLQPPSGS